MKRVKIFDNDKRHTFKLLPSVQLLYLTLKRHSPNPVMTVLAMRFCLIILAYTM